MELYSQLHLNFKINFTRDPSTADLNLPSGFVLHCNIQELTVIIASKE